MPTTLGIITERLEHYGGSEIYILECMRRWQTELDIVLYTTRCNPKLLSEFGIDDDRVEVRILEGVVEERKRFGLLDDLVLSPRIWERQIGEHDLYFQYLQPAQRVRKSPSIWFAAEPLRALYDLRHLENTQGAEQAIHVYPRMEYYTALRADLNVMLNIVEESDRHSRVETLVTNSRIMDGYLEAIYGRRADLVAYPGINLPEAPSGPKANRTALFVGRLWRHKRVDLVIDAMARLSEGNLLIVGDGGERKRLEQQVQSKGLEERVRFLGILDNQALDRVFRSVTCGVYTPFREPFGIMPIEAASHGLPTVVTPDGGYTEVLDASCAHIVPADSACIAKALDSLFSDHESARRMGAAARKKAEQVTWDHTAETLMELFRRTLRDRHRARILRKGRPLLGAHYYPWYGAGEARRHWNENEEYATVSDPPSSGIYSSNEPATVARHLALAEEAGLDYLVVNLQISASGLDPFEMEAVDLLFETADRAHPGFSLCLMLTCDGADSASIEAAIAQLEAQYFHHPRYLRLQSKPVVWFFISESFIGHFFYRFSELRESTRAYHCIAAAGFCFSKYLPDHYARFFDGWSLYSPLQISKPKDWEDRWRASSRDFAEVKSGDDLRVFTVCPGFDDTDLTHQARVHSKLRSISRRGTATYERMQKACMALKDPPELVVVTSFNEFHENTHIEPSEQFGRAALEATRRFSDALRARVGRDRRVVVEPPGAVAGA
jgi:glycosyltransferase involved in cell wall biosynthesis